MLKLLVFLLLFAAIVYALTRREPPRRPPRDPPGEPDPDPDIPSSRIGWDPGKKPENVTAARDVDADSDA